MMTAYFISSVAWAVLGLLVGFAIGRGARAAAAIEEAHYAMTEPTVPPPRARWWGNLPRPNGDQILGLLIVGLAIASVVVMAVSLTRQQTQIDAAQSSIRCQTEFNELFNAALRERTDAATQERSAQRALLTGVLTPGGDDASAQAAINRYLETLAAADARRAQSPLPTKPSCDSP